MDLLRLRDRSLLGQGALVAFVTYWAVWIIYTRWFHPLAKFPGPFWASVTRAWTLLHVLHGDAEKRQMKLHAKYGLVPPGDILEPYLSSIGSVVRIAPNELVTSEPEAIQTLYGARSFTAKMFGFLQAGHDHLGYIDATEDLVPIQFLAANMPTYVRGLFMLTGILFPKVRRALRALGDLTDATNAMLKDRLAAIQSDSEDKPQRHDILGKLLEISQKRGKELDFVLDDIKMESFGAL
ncbi:unnamed protein product [Aspergillus oryzae]|uniref:Unnamed protein product n=2 Tax=Aspergillus oryzae TaxID=5062 RepID=A0AAN5BVY2_ASPOZ|nr:unnamed protein product [Aspergillus oryzae]GMF89949.1 unnamed protein product [Aspergillus oryzae]GMG27489.1 unnamed protein product [Aspergillus oryzae]GMG54239.1 unnamed protein product [Aspergillus oryzae var. brunneus]